MATPDRLERLTDLVLVLLHASRPRTLEEIATAVPGYPPSREARRQAFERDKRVLREEGIPIVTEPVDGPEQYGYRIDPDAFYLPDLGLAPDEQAALHLAVAGVHLGDPSGRDALAKLGATGVAEARPVASLVPPPALVELFAALRAGAEVHFGYRGARRVVAPSSVRFRGGRWYLVGWDRDRGAARTFRVDRIEGSPELGVAGSADVPDGADAADAPLEPWRVVGGDVDDEAEVVHLLVDPVEAPRVVAEVGEGAVEERRDDGSVVLRLGVAGFGVLRSWVLGLLDHAVVVGPPAARAAMVSWLEATAAGGGGGAGAGGSAGAGAGAATLAVPGRRGGRDRAGAAAPVRDREGAVTGGSDVAPARAPVATIATSGTSAPAATSGPGEQARRPLPASARLRRLLAMVAWLAEVGSATIRDVSARFGLPGEEVVQELELAACCGVPPYSPDALLEIVVTEQTVEAFLPRDLSRPRRLTPREGLALAASARTILAVPGSDPAGALGRALAKLDAALGDDRRLVIELDAPPELEAVRDLVAARRPAEIEYHSASTDETTVRVVEPLEVLSLDGHWYLDAYCHRAGGVRRFRVDRIRTLRPLAQVESPLGTATGGSGGTGAADATGGSTAWTSGAAFVPGPGSVEVRLRLDADARWVVDTVPVLDEHESEDGTTEVALAVGGRAWLERLLLQAGPHARVLAPPEMVDAGRTAARRVLEAYGRTG